MSAYENAVARLYELGHELHNTPAFKFHLDHMRVLLAELGNPEQRFASVLIAGTNGKGSTAATLASILRAAGYHTGLYTSPHLVRINERINIDGHDIADTLFADVYERVQSAAERAVAKNKLPHQPSFFEMLTAMAFVRFADAGVQIAVVEVGLGGRLDATNVLEPCVSVIADIALDHQKYLGNTITEIAGEKAGIVRKDRPTVLLPQHPEANDALGKAILSSGARAVNATRNLPPQSPNADTLVENRSERTRYRLSVMGQEIEIDSPLTGRHQVRNLALAITAAEELSQCGFPITPDKVEKGIRESVWPGRLQAIAADAARGRPEIVIDVAHNPAGAWALRSALSERYPDRGLFFVFGAMRDKAIGEMAQILFPLAEVVVLTRSLDNPRSAEIAELRAATEPSGAEMVEAEPVAAALKKAFELARQAGAHPRPHTGAPLVVITGSIYVVGDALKELRI